MYKEKNMSLTNDYLAALINAPRDTEYAKRLIGYLREQGASLVSSDDNPYVRIDFANQKLVIESDIADGVMAPTLEDVRNLSNFAINCLKP